MRPDSKAEPMLGPAALQRMTVEVTYNDGTEETFEALGQIQQTNRDGYRQAGLIDELAELHQRLAQTLVDLDAELKSKDIELRVTKLRAQSAEALAGIRSGRED